MKRFKNVALCFLVTILVVSVPATTVEAASLLRKLFGKTDEGKNRKTVTYMIWGNPTEQATTQEVANVFNESQDKILVEVLRTPQETMVERLNTMAMAKKLPDTAMMDERAVIQWAEKGLLADIQDMYPEDGPKPMDALAFTYKGKTVAYSTCNVFLVMYYNKDLFDEAGVAYPPNVVEDAWDWNTFVSNAKKLTKDSSGKTPNDSGFSQYNIVQYGAAVETWTWQLETWARSNGGGFFNDKGTSVNIGRNDSIEALQRIADLHLVHKVAPLNAGIEDNKSASSFLAGNIAMATGGTWNIGTALAEARDAGLNYGIAVLPYMKKPVTMNAGGTQVVFKQTKNLPEAMEWVKWYSDIDNSWFLVEAGIWCPPTDDYYTDETLTHKWLDNDAYPPYEECKPVLVDYYQGYAQRPGWYYANNYRDFELLLQSALGDVWTGDLTAKEAITANLKALESAFAGK